MQGTLIQRQLARYMLHGMRHYSTAALMNLLQPLAIAVSGTQSAPANDAHETKQRQVLQHILRQIYDKVATRPGAAEHLAPIAEWGKRPGDAEKDEKKEVAADDKEAGGEKKASALGSSSQSVEARSPASRSSENSSPVK